MAAVRSVADATVAFAVAQTRCLAQLVGEIGHLALASLVGRNVGLRGGLLCRRLALIRNLQLLVARPGRQWLDIERPCEIAFERRRDWCIRRNDRRRGYALVNIAWDINPPSCFARL